MHQKEYYQLINISKSILLFQYQDFKSLKCFKPAFFHINGLEVDLFILYEGIANIKKKKYPIKIFNIKTIEKIQLFEKYIKKNT